MIENNFFDNENVLRYRWEYCMTLLLKDMDYVNNTKYKKWYN